VVIDPDARLDDFVDAVLGSCLEHLLANHEAARSSDDPEGVHQLRVAARRTRSILRTLRPFVAPAPTRQLRDALRWIGGALGPARDRDVFCVETLPEIRAALPGAAGLRRLAWEAELRRLAARRAARAAIDSERFAQGLLLLDRYVRGAEWRLDLDARRARRIRRPARKIGVRLLDGLFGDVRLLDRPFGQLTGAELHRLRIRTKRLRYASEIFVPLYAPPGPTSPPDGQQTKKEGRGRGKGKHEGGRKEPDRSRKARKDPGRRFSRRVRRLQDVLGRLNDGRVADALVQDVLDHVEPTTRGRLEHAAGIVSGWSHARARQQRKEAEHAWRRVAGAAPFWR
jgi:CHAD domain-containing protein